MLTAEKIRELFDYQPATGALVRRHRVGNQPAGAVAGCFSKDCWVIYIGHKPQQRARLVWIWHHGENPSQRVTHINGIGTDDRIENLRLGSPNGIERVAGSTDATIDISDLKAVLRYDTETGLWYRQRTFGQWKKGQIAGRPTANGYSIVKVFGTAYMAHRLAWFYMTGVWPSRDIDHIDGDRSNNRWSNLREATRAQNVANSRKRKAHGVKGVHLHRSRWYASITRQGRNMKLGVFDTMEQAADARRRAAEAFDGEFVRHD